MCRYVFVMFIFLCRPQDMYVQGLPSISCEAGEVTVGERTTITCIFPTGSITPGNSNFIVKKFTASNPRDGTYIMNCFYKLVSTIPECIFPNMSLGYNFTFVPENNRQTVVIPSAKQADAGEYGCDRINHMVTRCNLIVKDVPKPHSDPGAFVGIVIGVLVAVVLLGGAALLVWWRITWKPMVAKLLPATEDKALTLAMLEKEYPQEAWIRVYTNGSPRVHIQYPDGNRCTHYIKGLPCTNNRADLEALDHATNILIGNTDPNAQIFIRTDAMCVLDALIHDANTLSVTADPNAQIVFLTDAISVLEAATENKLLHLQKALQNIKCTKLVLQWIPSHCGMYGNKEADRMAKMGAEKEQDDNGVSDTEMKLIIDHNLSIQEQEIIFYLRTRHNRIIFHPARYFHLVRSPQCPCGKADQTMNHILQDCENHQPLRKEIWPKPTTLQEKLYGPVEALHKTAKFVCMMPNACSVFGGIIWKPMVAILLPATEDKALTLAMLEKEYPQKAWIRVYTDGSTGVHIQYPDGKCQTEAVPTGHRCTNCIKGLPCTNNRADLKALDDATNIMSGNTGPDAQIFIRTDAMSVLDALIHSANTLNFTADPHAQIVFLTDAISVLEAATENELPHLQKALQNIKCTRLVLQWIPSHCGKYRNEEADRIAKLGAEEDLDDNGVCVTEMKRHIDHNLSIPEQEIIFHLRTMHNRLNFHPHEYFHFVPSLQCPCGKVDPTMEHILQDCENHHVLRKLMWPKHTILQEKLYGPVKALQKTVKFVCMMPSASSVFGDIILEPMVAVLTKP